MKQVLATLFAVVISSYLVRAADVEIKLKVTTDPKGAAATSFAPDTPKLYALFDTTGIGSGDKVRGVLIAEDVGAAAPANTKVLEKTLTLNEDTSDGDFEFSKPTNGWPVGKYRVDIYVNDQLATTAKFTISSGEKQEAETTTSSGIPDAEELKVLTNTSVAAFGEAVKDKDFSNLYQDIAELWQKQTTPEKLRDAFADFYGKNIDLRAAIDGKDPVFNHPAAINSENVLVVQGYYPTTPNRVVFQLKYFKEEDDWKLVGLQVNLKD